MIPKMQFVSPKRRNMRRPLRYFFANREVKDRLFCYIFERDPKALLQLYNALNGTDYSDENALKIVTLDNVLYLSMNNDVAFMLMGTLNLYEHQSTICPNLPLRFLLYTAAEYEAYVGINPDRIYGSSLIRLPAPRCVVFYNGDEPKYQYSTCSMAILPSHSIPGYSISHFRQDARARADREGAHLRRPAAAYG